ncbi:MAG: hypothetical protein KatS3mg102_2537 [Planctomycetota bacterium]|nr:MAG: hypothetical protein KatS3mg102_2537 [Planctomycetota bacterium]
MRFYRWLLSQRVLVNLVFAVVFVAGALALARLPVEEFPNVSFDNIEIRTDFPGASPADVERLVTRPLEEAIEDVRGIDWVRSVSAADYSRILVKVLDDLPRAEFERIFRDLESEVRNALPELPAEVEPPLVRRIDVEAVNPVLTVVVGGDVPEEVLRAAADELERRLEALPGVRECRLTGRRDRELLVEVDPERLAEHELALTDVVAALTARSDMVPAGRLRAAGGAAELQVRAATDWEALAEVRASTVRGEPAGGTVRLDQVAEVHPGWEETLVRPAHGRPALASSSACRNTPRPTRWRCAAPSAPPWPPTSGRPDHPGWC